VDGASDPIVSAATAYIGHRLDDLVIGWLPDLSKKRGCRHNLPRLTVSALRNLFGNPGLLYRMRVVTRKALDRMDLLADYRRHWKDATPRGLAVDVYGASAALRDAAAELRPSHPKFVANHPQERHVPRNIELVLCTVHRD
jgi:hypothetical protein